MPNIGIIAGQVIREDGSPVSGADVHLSKVIGFDGVGYGITDKKGKKPIYAKSGGNGNFVLNYQWSGADFAEGGQFPATVFVGAWLDAAPKRQGNITSVQTLARGSSQAIGIHVKSVLEMTQNIINTYADRSDIEDFANSLGKQFVGMATTESWKLVSGVYIYIR